MDDNQFESDIHVLADSERSRQETVTLIKDAVIVAGLAMAAYKHWKWNKSLGDIWNFEHFDAKSHLWIDRTAITGVLGETLGPEHYAAKTQHMAHWLPRAALRLFIPCWLLSLIPVVGWFLVVILIISCARKDAKAEAKVKAHYLAALKTVVLLKPTLTGPARDHEAKRLGFNDLEDWMGYVSWFISRGSDRAEIWHSIKFPGQAARYQAMHASAEVDAKDHEVTVAAGWLGQLKGQGFLAFPFFKEELDAVAKDQEEEASLKEVARLAARTPDEIKIDEFIEWRAQWPERQAKREAFWKQRQAEYAAEAQAQKLSEIMKKGHNHEN